MKTFQSILPVFGLIAAAQAWGAGWNDTTSAPVTITVSEYTTYCPLATTFTQGSNTYSATASETLTITECPCTIVQTPTAVPHTYVSPPAGNATWIPPVWIATTVTVETLTTYCPSATTFSQGSSTYTVSEATTLTISECPCTQVTSVPAPASEYITSTFSTLTTYCPSSTVLTYQGQTYPVSTPGTATIPIVSVSPIAPSTVATPAAPATTPVGTAPVATTPTTGASSPASTSPVPVVGAAKQNAVGVGALAVAGLAMLI